MRRSRLLAVIVLAMLAASSTSPAFSQPSGSPTSEPGIVEARALTVVPARADQLWAVWEVDDGTDVDLYFSHGTGGAWAAAQPVHSRPHAWDRSPSLAVAADGTFWLAWSSSEKVDPNQTGLYTSRWTGRRWTDPETVPLGGIAVATEPVLAAASDNTLWLAWVGFDGVDEEIFASHWDGMSWSLPQQVSTDDQDPFLYDKQPHLAVGKNGQAWLAWTGHQSGVDDEIYVSRWTGTGWTPEQMISQDDNALDVWPSLVLDSRDRPWVVWDGQAGDEAPSRRRIFVAHWEPSLATWTAEEVISSPPGTPVDEEHPTLSLDASGRVRATWIVRGPSDSALGYAWYEDRWIEPLLARTGVNADVAFSIPGVDDTSQFFWIDAFADSTMPIESLLPPDTAEPLQTWMERQVVPQELLVDPVWNRHLAFGDSITWGQYNGFYPYPARLEDKLDARVVPSEVINSGVPGERTSGGKARIGGEVSTYRPQFVILMEGTNDVTHFVPPSEVKVNLMLMIDAVRRWAGVDHLRVMLGTLIPRLDERDQATQDMNEQAIAPAAAEKRVPLCDPWQAYHDYGPWEELYIDNLHPGETGLQILADTFYSCSLNAYTWLKEDIEPPTTWIESAQGECRQATVTWDGQDNMSWVVDYDVQAKVNSGDWTNWLLATTATSGLYTGALGDTLQFRVRGRDLIGNQSSYSTPVYTQLDDNILPEADVIQLPPYQVAPFTVGWWGKDTCSGIAAYRVENKVGLAGPWKDWFASTTATSASFTPSPLEYGQTYYFRVSARDGAGNWSVRSDPVSTILAKYTLSGDIVTIRDEPVIWAQVTVTNALAAESYFGHYIAYLANEGDYDLLVARDGFGTLPPMHLTSVATSLSGLDLVLPPHDDVIGNGGFEAADWGDWQPGGTIMPAVISGGHTGDRVARLGGIGGPSWLRQDLSVPGDLVDATFSFLVRLDDTAAGTSTLTIGLAGTPISHTEVVSTADWTHVWLPVDAAVGQAVMLTFTVSDNPAVRLDEVSLGTAIEGGSQVQLPLVFRASTP